MSINADLRNELLMIPELAAIVGSGVYEITVPQRDDASGWPDVPYVWLQQAGVTHALCTDDKQGQEPFSVLFDIDFVSHTVEECVAMGAIVRNHLHMIKTLGGQPVSNVLVTEHSDDHAYRNRPADSGVSIASLQAEIYP